MIECISLLTVNGTQENIFKAAKVTPVYGTSTGYRVSFSNSTDV